MTYDEPMREALALAAAAAADDEVPVGAVVVDADGIVIGRGRNRRERLADPLAHAEVEALRDAASTRRSRNRNQTNRRETRVSSWNLADCALVVTLEPCPMCTGAALQAHIGAVVFGAWDGKLGACGSVWDLARDPHIGHHPHVFGGVEESRCVAMLEDFFARRRVNG